MPPMDTHLALLAITTQPPQMGRASLEIPDIEPGQDILGRFSKSFMVKIARLFAEARGRTGRVNRPD